MRGPLALPCEVPEPIGQHNLLTFTDHPSQAPRATRGSGPAAGGFCQGGPLRDKSDLRVAGLPDIRAAQLLEARGRFFLAVDPKAGRIMHACAGWALCIGVLDLVG